MIFEFADVSKSLLIVPYIIKTSFFIWLQDFFEPRNYYLISNYIEIGFNFAWKKMTWDVECIQHFMCCKEKKTMNVQLFGCCSEIVMYLHVFIFLHQYLGFTWFWLKIQYYCCLKMFENVIFIHMIFPCLRYRSSL